MSHSKLATYINHSPNHSGKRNHKVDTLTPHYMDGNLSIETCAAIFKPTSRRASSNYGIGSDGRIGVYVEEENRAWTSGSSANDNRAITFECANLSGGKLTTACWNSLVKLCADICKRYGFKGVYYCGRADYSKLPDGYMLLTMHKWFQSTDCPGPWFSKQFSNLAKDINAYLESGRTPVIKPANNTQGGKLSVDGYGGFNTVLDMQHQLGTYEDGVISGQWKGNQQYIWAIESVTWEGSGSQMVKALQKKIGAEVDGIWGFETSTKLQKYLIRKGYSCGDSGADGFFGHDSVKALQRCLNDKKL